MKKIRINCRSKNQQKLAAYLLQSYFSFQDYFNSTSSNMIKSVEEWIAIAKQNKKYYFFYEDRALDLTCFMNIHPGGKKALVNYVYKDITQILFSVYPHRRDRTLQTLFEYSVGRIPPEDMKKRTKIERSVTPDRKEKKKVSFQKNFNKNQKTDKSQTEITSILMKNNQNKQPTELQKQVKKQNQHSKGKQKQKSKSKGRLAPPIQQVSGTSIGSDLDEHKPIFRVPILMVKNMNSI